MTKIELCILDDYNFEIKTNFEIKRFNIFTFNEKALESIFFAHVIINKKKNTEVQIVEKDNELYAIFENSEDFKININNNELQLISLNQHSLYKDIKNQISLMHKKIFK